MRCKFCYATFEDMHVGPQMSLMNAKVVIEKLVNAGVQKITFAGGEPLLYKDLKTVIIYAKTLGITTSIITNGSLLKSSWLSEMVPYLDWVGLSIDSLNRATQVKIGRITSKNEVIDYDLLIECIKTLGYRLKINTVVNAYNWDENMNSFIRHANPDRWKVFQALRVEGQNDKQWDDVKVSEDQYWAFIEKHKHLHNMIIEDNRKMAGSYLLVDPLGRLFENSSGQHTYSDTLIENDIDHCLSQINLNREMFLMRGGIYQW